MKKKGKEDFYAFRSVYKDIFVALISEFLCGFLNVDNLAQTCTPESLKKLEHSDRQKGFKKLFRSFIMKTHPEFENCSEDYDETKELPQFYPHQDYLRKKYAPQNDIKDEEATNLKNTNLPKLKPPKSKLKPDQRNSYAKSLLSIGSPISTNKPSIISLSFYWV